MKRQFNDIKKLRHIFGSSWCHHCDPVHPELKERRSIGNRCFVLEQRGRTQSTQGSSVSTLLKIQIDS